MTTEQKTEIGKKFIASQRAEYKRITLDIMAQYPVSVGSIIAALGKHYAVEQDRVEEGSAKLTICNLREND